MTAQSLHNYLHLLFEALGLEPPAENHTHLLPNPHQLLAATHRLQQQGLILERMLHDLPSSASFTPPPQTSNFSDLSTPLRETSPLSNLYTPPLQTSDISTPLRETSPLSNLYTPPLQTSDISAPLKIPTSLRQQRATLHVLLETSLRLLTLAHQQPRQTFDVSASFAAYCSERPRAKLDYDQLYCSPDSTERRCRHILSQTPKEARILLLGDDDLTSLALASHHHGPIHVIEFDPRLLDHIHTHAPHIHTHSIDLFLGALPRDLAHSFDVIALDPPWDDYHAWCFLHKALLALRPAPESRIYMAFCPLSLAWLERKAQRFWRRFAQYGLTFESIQPALHLYPLHHTEFQQLLLAHCPPLHSHLLQTLRLLPFGFSDLYTLRPIHNFRLHPLRRWFQRWWHLSV